MRRRFQKRGIMVCNPDFVTTRYWCSLNVGFINGKQMEKVIDFATSFAFFWHLGN